MSRHTTLPDFSPSLGLIDDTAVLTLLPHGMAQDLAAFHAWNCLTPADTSSHNPETYDQANTAENGCDTRMKPGEGGPLSRAE